MPLELHVCIPDIIFHIFKPKYSGLFCGKDYFSELQKNAQPQWIPLDTISDKDS